MAGKWVYRAAHHRRYGSGKVGYVRAYYFWSESEQPDEIGKKRRSANSCPYCGAKIETIRGSKGGWVNFEHGMSQLGTLHPCFTIGRGISKRLSETTPDLFGKPEGDERS